MTFVPQDRRKKTRKVGVSFVTLAILGLHGGLFLLLAQCGVKAPGYRNEVSFIRVQDVENHQVALEFREPPERMFYQFASMPLGGTKGKPVPLARPRWHGYQTLVALQADQFSPMDNYRLTMEVEKAEPRKRRPLYYQPTYRPFFRTVVVQGVPMQPVQPVPEPGTVALLGLAVLGVVFRRVR